MRRIRTALGVIAATLLLITGSVVPGAAIAQASSPDSSCVSIDNLFLSRWQQKTWAYGCAISPLAPTYNGLYQNFERGQMVWSPSQGRGMIVSGWWTRFGEQGNRFRLDFQWGTTDPDSYNKWLVRLDIDDRANLGQWDCYTGGTECGNTAGYYGFGQDFVTPGHSYQFRVEGCHYSPITGHNCPRSWAIPVWLWF
ncbi:hypothetical protein ACQPZF_05850 [Actinosynnema sp. CS-041913]|uniref:hypothetical protein n=1 Tax=Actinosynnema sp. CS-041913 TaxID=3239917 RepID=UPI003D90F1E2